MKERVFRDPVHGLIEFRGDDRPLFAIVETRAFQRLRRIKQMGFANLVYPGAEHSRFGHALGAFHVANRVSKALKLDAGVSFHIKVAALLHDIGHGPFSHSWEQILSGMDHEAWGARIIQEDDELANVLSTICDNLVEHLVAFGNKSYSPSFATKLVSSQLDVDRLDYLLRDGHYSGAGYATYDLDWIIHALRIEKIRSEPDSMDLVVDYRRGMYAVEQYLFARSYMYAQVYHHKTVRAAEWMFIKLFRRFLHLQKAGMAPDCFAIGPQLGQEKRVCDYLGLDDLSVSLTIDAWAGRVSGVSAAADPVIRDLSQRLISRRLFKTIELGDDPEILEILRPRVEEICTGIFGDQREFYYQLDRAQKVGYMPEDGELHVVGHPRYGTVMLGQLLEELPLGRPNATVRLVCAPEVLPTLRSVVQSVVSLSHTGG